MIITTGKSRRDTKWRREDWLWSELCERLSQFKKTSETMREYRAMSRDEQGRAKDVGGFVGGRLNGTRRCREAVADRCLVTLDADNAQPDTWEDVLVSWEEGAMCCYSTHSSTPEKPRLRFVIPLKRAVTPEEYPAVARKLAQKIGIDIMDSSTYDVCRLMYWPSCPMDGVPFFDMIEGEPVDPDRVLREYGLGEAWKDTTLWPIGKGEQEVVRREAKKQGDPREKDDPVGIFCRTYDVPAAINEFLSDVYEPCGGERYTYLGGGTKGGALVYDDGLFLFSYHDHDPCGGGEHCWNAFDLVRVHKFGALDAGQEKDRAGRERKVTSLPSYEAMCDFINSLDAVEQRRRQECSAKIGDMLEGEGPDDDEWMSGLTRNRKTGAVEPTIGNISVILQNSPDMKGVFALNLLTGEVVRRRNCPWIGKPIHDARGGDIWTDTDDAYLLARLESAWGISDSRKIAPAVLIAADRQAFDPLRDYLDGLVWDGTERLDTMLVRWMGAEDSRLNRAVTRKWMLSAVKRAYEPGCKVDHMLVLTGPQGIGKSELGRQLSRGWFTDSLSRLDNSKEAMESVKGMWIIEIAELAGMYKSQSEELKNFLTKQNDVFRAAYARRRTCIDRRCVFYGTTNDTSFLRDRTGNRRFWPVEVTGIARGVTLRRELAGEVDQLWAETVAAYRAGEANELFLPDELETEMNERRAAHHDTSDEDLLAERVSYILDKPVPEDWDQWDGLRQRAYYTEDHGLHDLGTEPEGTVRRTKIRLGELYFLVYGELIPRGNGSGTQRLSRAMDALADGWVKVPQMNGNRLYGRGVGYRRKGVAEDARSV